MEQLLDEIIRPDPFTVGIITALLTCLITLVFFLLNARKRSVGQHVLLLGVCDAGKTLLFSQLVYKQNKQTQTSMKENTGNAVLDVKQSKSIFSIVDLPGHERLRWQLLDKYRNTARAIAFVVDSATIQKEIKDVAEYLYNILVDKVLSERRPPVLIVCNKQDLTLAKTPAVVQSLLEKELNNLRITQSAALDDVGGVGNGETVASTKKWLGRNSAGAKDGGEFHFSHLAPWKITFGECSVKGKGDGQNDGSGSEGSCPAFKQVVEWLHSLP